MSDILKPKKQYKKRQTKQEIIDEYKGGFIDEPTYDPVYNDPTSVDELVEEEEKNNFQKLMKNY